MSYFWVWLSNCDAGGLDSARLSPPASGRGRLLNRNNLSHTHNNSINRLPRRGGVTSHPSHPPRSAPGHLRLVWKGKGEVNGV